MKIHGKSTNRRKLGLNREQLHAARPASAKASVLVSALASGLASALASGLASALVSVLVAVPFPIDATQYSGRRKYALSGVKSALKSGCEASGCYFAIGQRPN